MAVLHLGESASDRVRLEERCAHVRLPVGYVGYVSQSMSHYVWNTGNKSLRYLELFKANTFVDVSLNSA